MTVGTNVTSKSACAVRGYLCLAYNVVRPSSEGDKYISGDLSIPILLKSLDKVND